MSWTKRVWERVLELILAPSVVALAIIYSKEALGAAVAMVVLLIICIGLWEACLRLSKQRIKLEAANSRLSTTCTELQAVNSGLSNRCSQLEQGLSAAGSSQSVLNLALNHPGPPVDNANHYTLVKFFGHIDGNGNYRAKCERRGINQSRDAVRDIRIQSCADSKATYKDLDVQAFDLIGNEALRTFKVDDDPRQKKFDIRFRKPVATNEPFAVEWSYLWPTCLRASDDYDFILLKGLNRGVEKLSYTLEFEWKLPAYRFLKLTKGGEWELLTVGLEQPQGNFYCYPLELKNPDSEAYKFEYD